MTAPIRHSNTTQEIQAPQFRPLLQAEAPYFNNINRAPTDAFNYADAINNVFSYGGYVSIVKPTISNSAFSLYTLVKISDYETIDAALNTDPQYGRYGIVVTEMDSNGNYVICTFCPNFVYPNSYTLPSTIAGTSLYLNEKAAPLDVSLTSNGNTSTIGNYPIAKVTGQHSIFFSGTVRLF